MFEKITDSDISKRSVAAVATTPNRRVSYGESGMDAAQLKARFDLLPKHIAERLNEIFVGLTDGTLADALNVNAGDQKISLGALVSSLLEGDVGDVKIKTIYETISLLQLGALVLEMRDGLKTGELADKMMLSEEESLRAFCEKAEALADMNIKEIAEMLTDEYPVLLGITKGAGEGSIQSVGDRSAEGTSADTAIYEDKNGNEVFDYNSDFNTNAKTVFKEITGLDFPDPVPYGAFGRYAQVLTGKGYAPGKRAKAGGTTNIAWGDYSSADGNTTMTLGPASHSDGLATIAAATASWAWGLLTIARGPYSMAGGEQTETTKKAEGSFVGGYKAKVDAKFAFAFGYYCSILAENGFAVNQNTKVNTKNGAAFGLSTIADGLSDDGELIPQFVLGRYNAPNKNALLIVGDGTSSSKRHNAFEVLKDGTMKVYSTPSEDADMVNKKYVDDVIGDISKALDELHAYAQSLVNGG